MFFFVLTSQVVGSPFMLETMLRSGVPPHIGQSPLPGSERAISECADRDRPKTRPMVAIESHEHLAT